MNVWTKVYREECLRVTGKPPVKLRWIDVNKGDDTCPNYRSRIVAKEIKKDLRPELFAATPPLEYIKYLISRCASRQGGDVPSRLMVQDISKAYFFAPATRDIYIELPPEDAEEGMVGKLEKSLYGTRDAALNWAEAYTKVLLSMGYKKGTSSPCSFYHREWQIRTVVHGDDFLSEGSPKSLKKMDEALRKDFLVKTEVIGPDALKCDNPEYSLGLLFGKAAASHGNRIPDMWRYCWNKWA